MVMLDIDSPGFYRKLPLEDKARYHGRGCVYNHGGGKGRIRHPNCWRIEWSSGRRGTYIRSKQPKGKILYNSLTVWGTYAEARALLDLIVAKPYRQLDEAKAIIAPYIEWASDTGGGARKRVIRGPVPPSNFINPGEYRRRKILLDYWRLKLLDTLEEYRRLGDD